MHASFSVNLYLCLPVCVCVCSCLFCLHCCCLTALITFVIIRTFSYQRWVFFVFLLSSVRACTPVIVACFALLLSLSCCVLTAAALPTTTSILHSRSHSLSISYSSSVVCLPLSRHAAVHQNIISSLFSTLFICIVRK